VRPRLQLPRLQDSNFLVSSAISVALAKTKQHYPTRRGVVGLSRKDRECHEKRAAIRCSRADAKKTSWKLGNLLEGIRCLLLHRLTASKRPRFLRSATSLDITFALSAQLGSHRWIMQSSSSSLQLPNNILLPSPALQSLQQDRLVDIRFRVLGQWTRQ